MTNLDVSLILLTISVLAIIVLFTATIVTAFWNVIWGIYGAYWKHRTWRTIRAKHLYLAEIEFLKVQIEIEKQVQKGKTPPKKEV